MPKNAAVGVGYTFVIVYMSVDEPFAKLGEKISAAVIAHLMTGIEAEANRIIIGKTLIDYAVPTLLIRCVCADYAGSYHAWRLALQNAGTLLATLVAPCIPIPILLIIAALFQAISCFLFYINTKNSIKQDYNKT